MDQVGRIDALVVVFSILFLCKSFFFLNQHSIIGKMIEKPEDVLPELDSADESRRSRTLLAQDLPLRSLCAATLSERKAMASTTLAAG